MRRISDIPRPALFIVAASFLSISALQVRGSEEIESHVVGTIVSVDVEGSDFVVEAREYERDGEHLPAGNVRVIVDAETEFKDPVNLASLQTGADVEVEGVELDDGVLAGKVELNTDPNDDCEEQPIADFALSDVVTAPEVEFDVPFQVTAINSLSLVTWSVEYDPQKLTFVEPRLSPTALAILEGRELETDFVWFGDAEEGWLQVSVVFDFLGREETSFRSETTCCLANLCFITAPGVEGQATDILFTRLQTATYESNFSNSLGEIYNVARSSGTEFDDDDEFEDAEESCTRNSQVIITPIIGEIGIFRRGDSNLDNRLDVTDPIYLLGALFLGRAHPICPDVADANEDGSIDISDPVIVLHYLFSGASSWQPTEVRPLASCIP